LRKKEKTKSLKTIIHPEALPWPWKKALPTMIPGFLAAVGLLDDDLSTRTMIGMGLLIILLWLSFFSNQRQLPSWNLVALGSLAAMVITLASGVLGGVAALLVGGAGKAVVLLLFWGAIMTLLGKSLPGRPMPPLAWVGLGLIVMCQLGVRIKYFAFYGVSWQVIWEWLNVSLFSAGFLLLPLAIGVQLANRHGQATMLFLIGAIYMGFQILADNGGYISAHLGESPIFSLYRLVPPFLFMILAPICFTRILSAQGRQVVTMTLIGMAMIFDILFSGLVRGDFSTLIWLSAIPYVLSILLSFGLGFYMYSRAETVA
jgi:hypothetical protein